eukprot:GILI01027439.1.p1 GENE.GILI01027439.1~~GILI01027439.1.p1  ORF type:complete len:492 (+),score=53.41 GILI01027439.1:133-1476(+)
MAESLYLANLIDLYGDRLSDSHLTSSYKRLLKFLVAFRSQSEAAGEPNFFYKLDSFLYHTLNGIDIVIEGDSESISDSAPSRADILSSSQEQKEKEDARLKRYLPQFFLDCLEYAENTYSFPDIYRVHFSSLPPAPSSPLTASIPKPQVSTSPALTETGIASFLLPQPYQNQKPLFPPSNHAFVDRSTPTSNGSSLTSSFNSPRATKASSSTPNFSTPPSLSGSQQTVFGTPTTPSYSSFLSPSSVAGEMGSPHRPSSISSSPQTFTNTSPNKIPLLRSPTTFSIPEESVTQVNLTSASSTPPLSKDSTSNMRRSSSFLESLKVLSAVHAFKKRIDRLDTSDFTSSNLAVQRHPSSPSPNLFSGRSFTVIMEDKSENGILDQAQPVAFADFSVHSPLRYHVEETKRMNQTKRRRPGTRYLVGDSDAVDCYVGGRMQWTYMGRNPVKK